MSDYFRTEEMMTGGPFKCPNCGRTLAKKMIGSVYNIIFECPRCKTTMDITCKEPIPFIKGHEHV